VKPTGDDQIHQALVGRVTDTPVPVGASLPTVPIIVGGTDASAAPDGVTNWDFFQGALLAVVVKRPDTEPTVIEGTAVMIAPGLALTASHVFRDLVSDIASGQAALACIGIRTNGLDIWPVRNVSYTDADDLSYLSLEPQSAFASGWQVSLLPLTTRAPAVGEELTIVGFRFLEVRERGTDYIAEGDLYAAKGEVTAVYHPMRDAVRMPFPAIEIACDSLGGMSGGAVLDGKGFLVGIVSSGYPASEGQTGTTYAAWVIRHLTGNYVFPGLRASIQVPCTFWLYRRPFCTWRAGTR